jgi:hypothetical protein
MGAVRRLVIGFQYRRHRFLIRCIMADPDDGAQRLKRLAARARQLDDMIQKAAQMQKRIVDEIEKIGVDRKLVKTRLSRAPAAKPRKRR